MIAGAEERGVEEADDILDGAGFGDGRENIAGLDAFDDFCFDLILNARANARARYARERTIIRGN